MPKAKSKPKKKSKRKYKVHPSAYSNSYAAKRYKAMGGGWKSKPKSKK